MSKTAGSDLVSATNDPQQILFKTLPDIEESVASINQKITKVQGTTGPATSSNFSLITADTLASSNPDRVMLTIFNEGPGTLYLLYGAGTASLSNYSVRLSPSDYLELDKYTGQVGAIFASAGNAKVTEIS